ncbi:hypothetical protein Leucomu_05805 [Leucobacter muris]|uniref:Uncharacterized protein n=1 Tax=Leucobacter muris TaxID=1935379 RepID=A0ABX5QEP2_9MICO|nr:MULTISPECIES: hypothetical protein [Leucobacter]QAB17500.1 hypothetical protein Leucomu_05805 [Leucobacter muris]
MFAWFERGSYLRAKGRYGFLMFPQGSIASVADAAIVATFFQDFLAWFTAIAALLSAFATVVASAVAAAVAWLGFKLSKQTHELQREVQEQRREREVQAENLRLEQEQRVQERRENGMRAMEARRQESELEGDSIAGPHAWFVMEALDSSGTRFSLRNTGDRDAANLGLSDASQGCEGEWRFYPDAHVTGLAAGESVEVLVPSWDDGRLGQMAKLSWGERDQPHFPDSAYREQFLLIERPSEA